MTNQSIAEKTIINLKPGESFTGYLIIRKTELKSKKDGSPYLVLGLGDSTGRISATLWDDAQKKVMELKPGFIVKVQGKIITFNDTLQLSIDRIRPANESENIDIKTFLPKTSADLNKLKNQFYDLVESIKNKDLKRLLKDVFDTRNFEAFCEAPGGKLWHHACLGGLLEHTMAIAAVCETMAEQYPDMNRDLLIAGALLHDIGKLDEYTYKNGYIDFTDEGRLLGHISIGAQRLRSCIDRLNQESPFPDELRDLVLHMILSHQGKLEHGSPVLPATMEAMVLYYADEMDSKANALQHIIEKNMQPDAKWSPFVPLLERFIYLKANDIQTEEPVPESLFDIPD